MEDFLTNITTPDWNEQQDAGYLIADATRELVAKHPEFELEYFEIADEETLLPFTEKELKKIPFFVRGKARRNTELFARERGVSRITVETMYEAKAHFSR